MAPIERAAPRPQADGTSSHVGTRATSYRLEREPTRSKCAQRIIPRTHRASCGGRLDPDRNVGRRIANLRTAYDEADRGERISRRRPAPIVGAPRSVDGAVYDVRGTRARLKLAMGFEGQGRETATCGFSRGVASGRSSGRACRGRRSRGMDAGGCRARRLCGQHGDGRASLDRGSPGGRFLFGDPTLYVASQDAPTPATRLAVVVVMAVSIARRSGGRPSYPAIADLDRFRDDVRRSPRSDHRFLRGRRQPSHRTLAACHGLEDTGARLPAALTTLASRRVTAASRRRCSGVPDDVRCVRLLARLGQVRGLLAGWKAIRRSPP